MLIPSVKGRNILLTIASLVFYAYGEPLFVFVLLFVVLLHYAGGLLILKKEKIKKAALISLLVFDVVFLLTFKYAGFFAESVNLLLGTDIPVPKIDLPIGISFFTFQMASYIIDSYRNKEVVRKRFSELLLYVSFFPQLIAGPIIRYNSIEKEINDRTLSPQKTAEGFRRFIFGLSKKVVISGAMASVADSIFSLNAESVSLPVSYMGSLSYGLQIYYDFSGYSDMAIGMGKMFGFDFPENFNYPYSALSVSDFWRRWHISLTSWFREYVYIPLGGNKKGLFRTVVNIFIVFLLTGLWHGASFTFVVWGLYHAVFMAAERLEIIPVDKIKFKPVKWLYQVFVSFTGFIIFRVESLSQSFVFIKSLFMFGTIKNSAAAVKYLDPYFVFILIIAVIFSFPVKDKIEDKVKDKKFFNIASYVLAAVLLLLNLFMLMTDSYNPFIYFNF